MNYLQKKIADGVSLVSVPASRFKTNEIAFSFALPLDNDTVSVNALTINLLSRKCRAYPDMKNLNKKLAFLCGATIQATVSKLGECQVLRIGITCLDDRFSLDEKSISYECVELLCSLLFEPRLDSNGRFFEEDIASEKRILTEKISAEENEKRTYVLRQAEALMFSDEPYGINRYGTVQQVKNIDGDAVLSAWNTILSRSKVMVTVVGNTDIGRISELLSLCFSAIKRDYEPLPPAVFVPECKEVKEKKESIEVKQGKLVIGFRVNLKPNDKMTTAMRIFCDIFGGGPYSKLFTNVREKMSLCYYCSARYTRHKSYIMIQCGCSEKNMDKAVKEILNQLEEIKSGHFNDELISSKMAMRDAILSVDDTPEATESWYASQIIDKVPKTPMMSAEENEKVTKRQVKKCASLLSLDTIYKLTAKKETE